MTKANVLRDWPIYEVNQARPSNIAAPRVINEVPIEPEANVEEMNPTNITQGTIGAEDDVLDEVGVSGDALGDVGEEPSKVGNLESAVVGHESEESVNSYAVAKGEVQNT